MPCSCGHEQTEEAGRLQKRVRVGLGAVLFLLAIEVATRGATGLMWVCIALQVVALGLCAWCFVRQRQLVCTDAQ